MNESKEKLIGRLQSETDKEISYFLSLKPDDWKRTIYANSPFWSIKDLFAHLVSADEQFTLLFQDIKDGGTGAPEDLNINEFNAKEQGRLSNLTPDQLITQYRNSRDRLIAWISNLSPEDLSKQGRHPALGTLSLWEMIRSLTLHSHLHIRDIHRLLEVQ